MSEGRERDIHPGDKLYCTYAYEVRSKIHLTQHPVAENDQCQVYCLQIKSLVFMGESYEL